MAQARAQGAIEWSHEWPQGRGILLWESQEDAAAWQIARAGRPTVVLELGVEHILTGELERVSEPTMRQLSHQRMWLYPHPIHLRHVRWHTYRLEVAEPARVYRLDLPEGPPPEPAAVHGIITLDT